jgi:hypothetical protein
MNRMAREKGQEYRWSGKIKRNVKMVDQGKLVLWHQYSYQLF